MKRILTILVVLIFCTEIYGQSVEELYNNRDFKALVKLEKKSDGLTGDELYMVGYAFFQMEDDAKAIQFYDKAIAKGLNNGTVHFYKGLSLRFMKKYKDAMEEIDMALKLEPENQEFMNEKGLVFFYEGKEDRALEVFEAGKKLPATFPEPFYWSAYILHNKGEYDKALKGYYEAASLLEGKNSHYLMQ